MLFKQYVAHCDRVNPELEKMAPADLDALIDALKKSANAPEVLALRLTELSVSQLHNLALYLLKVVTGLPDKSSGGSSMPR